MNIMMANRRNRWSLRARLLGGENPVHRTLLVAVSLLTCQVQQLLAFSTRPTFQTPQHGLQTEITQFRSSKTHVPPQSCAGSSSTYLQRETSVFEQRRASSQRPNRSSRGGRRCRRRGLPVMWATPQREQGRHRNNGPRLQQQRSGRAGDWAVGGSRQGQDGETTMTINQRLNFAEGDDSSSDGAGLETSEDEGSVMPREKSVKGKGQKKDKSVLGKVGDATKTAFNAVMGAATLASLLLAAETIWELQGTPLTFANALPTITKLLPLTGLGVFGAAQLVGLAARVIRVIVTLPIMISGTWVILQNIPQILPKGADLSGAGSLAAILATPEVLETVAVLTFLAGMVIWTINFTRGALAAFGAAASSGDEDER